MSANIISFVGPLRFQDIELPPAIRAWLDHLGVVEIDQAVYALSLGDPTAVHIPDEDWDTARRLVSALARRHGDAKVETGFTLPPDGAVQEAPVANVPKSLFEKDRCHD